MAVVVLMAASLSGCWLQIGNGPGNTRFNAREDELTIDNAASLTEQWSVSVDGTMSEPIVMGNQVYVTAGLYWSSESSSYRQAQRPSVWAMAANSGETLWERSLVPEGIEGEAIATPVVQIDSALWVAYGIGRDLCASRLARLDPATGAVLTDEEAQVHRLSGIVAAGSIVAYRSCGNTLVVRDVETREMLWKAQDVTGTPTIAHGKILVEGGLGALHAYDIHGCGEPTCEPLWSLRPDASPDASFRDRPVAGPDGQIFVGHGGPGPFEDDDYSATLYAVDADTGQTLWRTSNAYRALAVAYGNVYVAGPSKLEVYPTAGCGGPTCDPAWEVQLDATPGAAGPLGGYAAVAGGVVYLTAGGGTSASVVAVAADGCGEPICDEILRIPVTDAFFIWNPHLAVAHGRLYLAGVTGLPRATLRAFAPTDEV